jgi:hypothetical protein
MRKHIRAILDDVRKRSLAGRKRKENPVVAEDLDNQVLSQNPAQRVRQLDWQAQKSEERQNS